MCDQGFSATADYYESGFLVSPPSAPISGDPIDDSDICNPGGDNDQSFFASANNCDQFSAASASYYCESVFLVSPRSAPISGNHSFEVLYRTPEHESSRLEFFCERVAFAPDSCCVWNLPPNPTQADVVAAAAAAAATAAAYKPSRAARRGLQTRRKLSMHP